MKTIKTDAEWDSINFKNSLGPQIGGLIKQAVDLAIAEKKISVPVIKYWIDELYEIAEAKKKELLTPKPLNETKAVEMGKEWHKKNKRAYSDVKSPKWNDVEEANKDLGRVSDKETKERAEIEAEMADSAPERLQERNYENKPF